MKKIVLVTLLASISSIATATPYVQGSIGYSKVSAKADGEKLKDNGVTYQVAVGNQINNIRYALDYTQYNKVTDGADDDKTTIKTNSIGGSVFYDFATASSAFTPYVGARVGYNRLKFSTPAENDKDEVVEFSVNKNRVGYGVIAGVSYKINPQLSADVNVQYNDLGTIKWTDEEGEVKLKTKQTGLNVGLRYQF